MVGQLEAAETLSGQARPTLPPLKRNAPVHRNQSSSPLWTSDNTSTTYGVHKWGLGPFGRRVRRHTIIQVRGPLFAVPPLPAPIESISVYY